MRWTAAQERYNWREVQQIILTDGGWRYLVFLTLNNGVKMPMAGIGTFLLSPDEAEASVLSAHAVRLPAHRHRQRLCERKGRGPRHEKIRCGPSKEIFLETKLWPSFYEQPDAVEKTLERLDTDYIDLLLIHQPAGNLRGRLSG